MKGISVLGSSGSIGRSTLDVVASFPEEFRVLVLAGGRNVDLLEEQVRRHRPEAVAMADPGAAAELRRRVGRGVRVLEGRAGIVDVARHPQSELVVCGIVGAAGLESAYAAVDAGKSIALANKEALVAGGAVVMRRARETGAMVLPVDSEHNALHQCLRGEHAGEVRALWLTASGGPFLRRPLESLATATREEALRHPTWRMGPKITVDSATLMNKGLEVIEARWLFDVPASRIRVVIHPTSVVHSMVEFVDGSFKAQMGITDMRHPIQYALTWPRRLESALPPFDPAECGALEFERPDPGRFPCLGLAYRALGEGGAAAAVLNAANEVAVQAFLEGGARFLDIAPVIRAALDRHAGEAAGTIEEIIAADARARATAAAALAQGVRS